MYALIYSLNSTKPHDIYESCCVICADCSTSGVFSTLEGYHDSCEGDTMSTLEGGGGLAGGG